LNLTEENQKLKCVAVSKGRTVHEINDVLAQTGLTRIAENRLEEAELKFPRLSHQIEKHFIGKLQSRKIPQIVKLFDVIQTVENEKQLRIISEQERPMEIMIQVNLDGSPERSGCSPDDFQELKSLAQSTPNIELIGVMGMASNDPGKAPAQFAQLKSLQGDLLECSMGMSSDYPAAIAEGSTMLRLGTLLFERGLPEGIELQ
jgi:uncharacterized pyridoxal phosphate-containing UPF0001 family protein